ncbi:MAG: sugar phosphate isomerase/epimerase family protein [Bacteroidota bacterium]
MPKIILILTLVIAAALFSGCRNTGSKQPDMERFYAWCIVPFDYQERTPEQRIEMLKELGFTAYAYDWREKHLPEMAREIQLARDNNIDVTAVWMWLDKNDAAGNLSENNRKVLEALAETGLETQIWVSFPEDYFEGTDEEEKVENASEMISYVSLEAEDLGCKVGLYNHGGWFGRPENLVRIIENMPRLDLGIVFNFHHAHDMIEQFPELVKTMEPYLWAVNLNGMNPGGPKILPIGKGEKEAEMVAALEENGYNGPYGILGHVEDADVKKILSKNLEGLKALPIDK